MTKHTEPIDVNDAEHQAWRAQINELVQQWRTGTVDVREIDLEAAEAKTESVDAA